MFHDDAVTALQLEEVKDLNDRRMRKRRCGSGFVAKTPPALGGKVAAPPMQALDGKMPIQSSVPGKKDASHASAT